MVFIPLMPSIYVIVLSVIEDEKAERKYCRFGLMMHKRIQYDVRLLSEVVWI